MPLPGPFRVKFDHAFHDEARTRHLARHHVERVLRWPRLVDDLAGVGGINSADRLTVWLANPPLSNAEDPSSILVLTRDRRGTREVQDAWRVYHSDVPISRVRSAREALFAFLNRYGIELQIGSESRRLFTASRVPMGPSGNAEARLPDAVSNIDVRLVQILELFPENASIDVSLAYAVNATSVRADLARHTRRAPLSERVVGRLRLQQ